MQMSYDSNFGKRSFLDKIDKTVFKTKNFLELSEALSYTAFLDISVICGITFIFISISGTRV